MTEIRLTNGNAVIVADSMQDVKDILNLNKGDYIALTLGRTKAPIYINKSTISSFFKEPINKL